MKSYKFKLKPLLKIAKVFEQWLAVCRELYNAGLEERRNAWKSGVKSVNYYSQSKQLVEIRRARPDVDEVSFQVLQQTLWKLHLAFEAFFRRIKRGQIAGYPRYKRQYSVKSFTYSNIKAFWIEGSQLYLPKIGVVRVIQHRPIEGQIKACTVKREADGWYVVVRVEENQSRFIPKTGLSVGLDVGVENFAVLSNGDKIENPNFLRSAFRELKTSQRTVMRRKKGSARRKQAAMLLAKHHQKVTRKRLDFHHKVALSLVKQFDTIVVEKLNINRLAKNRSISLSILDVAWGEFFTVLSCKAENAGRQVIKVKPHFTSQDCSQCGSRSPKKLSVRVHHCHDCGFTTHRDHNAAINIKTRGGTAFRDRGEISPRVN